MIDLRFFSDGGISGLQPLALLREPQELRCGILTLKEKIEADLKKLKSPLTFLINSRLLMDAQVADEIKKIKSPVILMKGSYTVVAAVKKGQIDKKAPDQNVPKKQIKATLIEYPWDLIFRNGEEIAKDIVRIKTGGAGLKPARTTSVRNAYIVNPKSVYFGKNVAIKPGVVLDAENGPIFIDDNATILANSVITGPVYVGKGSTVKAIAKIYGDTTIGPMCKIGGEVEATIFHGYSNKQHDGFIGHSYIGEWVNLGADTNNSDLKNNYANVKVVIGGQMVDTGRMFMGLVMGDHSKSGINTMFNTGTIIGVSCNLFGASFHEKNVPSFTWGSGGRYSAYELEKAIQTAKAVMARRGVKMPSDYEKRFREVFDLAKNERRS